MNDLIFQLIFLLNIAATLFMLGIIWFVQIVHYPLLAKIGVTEFPKYEQAHTRLITWIVGPAMLCELGTSVLLFLRPGGLWRFQCEAGLGLLAIIWLSTLFLQVPCHNKLSDNFDLAIQKRLVSTNWIRTFSWSLRGLLVLWMAWSVLSV